MKTYIGVMLAAALVLPAAAGAQEKKPFVEARGSVKSVPLPPGGPAPRMSDGHVDLSGNWFPGPTGKANAWSVDPDPRVPEDPVPFQPWAEAKFKAMSRVDLELSSANVTCDPVGTPGMFVDNAYMHLIDTKPGLFIHLIENNNRWRVVHTDGRPHKAGRARATVQRRRDGTLGRRHAGHRLDSIENARRSAMDGSTATSCTSSNAFGVPRRTISNTSSRSRTRKC